MKKLLPFIVAVSFISGIASAQPNVKIGPEIGATFVTMQQRVSHNNYDTKYQAGFRMGAVADISLGSSKFYFQPGLSLVFNNGTKSTYSDFYATEANMPASLHDERNYHVTSLNLPFYFVYKTGQYADYPHFFVGLGVFLNANIGGRFVQNYTTLVNGDVRVAPYNRPIYIGNTRVDDDIAIWDVGPTATIGYEMPMGLFFRAYYNYGLLNQAPGNKAGDSWHNMGGGITVGFLIKTKPGQTWGWK